MTSPVAGVIASGAIGIIAIGSSDGAGGDRSPLFSFLSELNAPAVFHTKRALLRVAAFLLIFLTTHRVLLWLHPIGAHRFFWNLAFSALASWLLVRLLLPSLDTKREFKR
jgi:hypothetical protein